MFNKQRKIITTFLMSLLMVCLLAVPAFASGTNPLDFTGANLCTISGQTATPGMSIVGATNVTSGSQHIELQFDRNVASTYTNDGVTPELSTNQAHIHLRDLTTSTDVSISVYRLGDGTPLDPEKQHLFFDANLVSHDSYEITLDPEIICYNGTTLVNAPVYIDFTAQ